MKALFKLWLDQDGKAFGEGPYELLKKVETTGSLLKAATEMGMAYSKAWKLIRMIEQRLGFPILERKAGGRSGGGSRITPRAKDLMSCYAGLRKEAQEAVDRIFKRQLRSFKKAANRKTQAP